MVGLRKPRSRLPICQWRQSQAYTTLACMCSSTLTKRQDRQPVTSHWVIGTTHGITHRSLNLRTPRRWSMAMKYRSSRLALLRHFITQGSGRNIIYKETAVSCPLAKQLKNTCRPSNLPIICINQSHYIIRTFIHSLSRCNKLSRSSP